MIKKENLPECPVATTVSLIGSKWKLLILRDLLTGTKRFGQLKKSLPDISQKVLTESLKSMIDDGIVERVAYPEVPPRVEYSLTDLGESMRPVISVMEQWGKEYNDQNYDGMKKVYLIWILPQAAKKRDGQVSICKTDEEKQLEKVETYDKREQIVIYLDKEHDTSKKYQEYDEILTPLVVFLNNILDYQGKIRIMKEYGFKEIEREVREVCDYANMLEKEYLNKGIGIGVEKGIEQGTQNERIKNIRKLMIKLKMSFKEAIQFLDIPEDEVKEIEKYFKL